MYSSRRFVMVRYGVRGWVLEMSKIDVIFVFMKFRLVRLGKEINVKKRNYINNYIFLI